MRNGTSPKGRVALDEIERNPYKTRRKEGQPVPASLPQPGRQRSAGVIDGVLFGDQLLIVSAGHGKAFSRRPVPDSDIVAPPQGIVRKVRLAALVGIIKRLTSSVQK
jgi:hypothetical protein